MKSLSTRSKIARASASFFIFISVSPLRISASGVRLDVGKVLIAESMRAMTASKFSLFR